MASIFDDAQREIKRLDSLQGEEPELDYSKISNVQLEDVNTKDYPDFCDAYISYAEYDGREMTERELEILNEDGDYVYEQVMNYLY